MRVLMWILARCADKADAVETPIGFEPKPEDIDVDGLDGVTTDTVRELLYVDKDLWRADCADIREFYAKFGGRVPDKLLKELEKLENNVR